MKYLSHRSVSALVLMLAAFAGATQPVCAEMVSGQYESVSPVFAIFAKEFTLTEGKLLAPDLLTSSLLSDLTVDVSGFAFAQQVKLADVLKITGGAGAAEFSISNPALLDPNDTVKGTGTITASVSLMSNTTGVAGLDALNLMLVDFTGVQVDASGAATWPFPAGSDVSATITLKSTIPEPDALILAVCGLLGLAAIARNARIVNRGS